MTLSYDVSATVAPELVAEYETFMRQDHIPAVLATGCFAAARFCRDPDGRYLMRYEAADRAALERYLAAHAPALRAEFNARFPAGVALSRVVWEVVDAWP